MYRESFINRLLYLLNLFATSVIFFFFCYDFFLILFAWECIGLFSFLLVNFYSIRIYTLKAALKTFIFSRISDMFMFFSFILTILIFNTTDLSLIFLQIPFYLFHFIQINNYLFHFLSLFGISIVLSGTIKAAQFFFHVWLPDAMEAPTPASALIHSSTLVIAGVFLIIRFSILFEFLIYIDYFLILLGAITLSFASITAIFQNDIKKLVAYSTISQIGYLVCGCGFCSFEEVLLYLIIHALNKAYLFILVGYIVHYFNGNTDLRYMGGINFYSFDITIFLLGTSINLIGLPYSAGFFSKEFLLFQIFLNDYFIYFIRGCWLISFFFTPIYMFLIIFIVIFGLKKSYLITYQSIWFYFNNYINKLNNLNFNYNWKLYFNYFQITNLTSKTTSLVLFVFFLLLFYLGEFFLLILFNFSNISDSINSHFFFILKPYSMFLIYNYSFFLIKIFFFFFIFFSY